jgi:hypothetical protein
MFLMSSQVKKFSQRELRDKKHQHFSTVSLPTDSVIVDHAVLCDGNGNIVASLKVFRVES